MIIVDNIIQTDGGAFKIPQYHGGHLSLTSGTEVTVCLLPPSDAGAVQGMQEIIVSPIAYESWQYLTRITATFHDIPGVVRKLAHALKSDGLNIMYEESASIDNGQLHRVEVLFDASNVYAQFQASNSNASALLPRLERKLKAICYDELVLDKGDVRLKVRPMEGLRRAWKAASKYAASPHVLRLGGTNFGRTPIKDAQMAIPPHILAILGQPSPRLIMVSDTRDRILRMLVPGSEQHFTYIRVAHQDTIGSFFRIADALAYSFTAVVTLTRLQRQGSRNDVELLLHCSALSGPGDDLARRRVAESLLADNELANLNIVVSYPERAGGKSSDEHKPEKFDIPIPQQRHIAPIEIRFAGKSALRILKAKVEGYLSSDEDLDMAGQQRRDDRIDVARAIARLDGMEHPPSPQIFVSFHFRRQELFDAVSGVLAHDKSCRVASGRDPNGIGHPFRDVIIKRIRASQGFVAVWGNEKLSPWLLWELGVAQAFGIPICLFVHRDLKGSPHLRILPEVHHVTFIDTDLREVFRQRWNFFQHEVALFDKQNVGEVGFSDASLGEGGGA